MTKPTDEALKALDAIELFCLRCRDYQGEWPDDVPKLFIGHVETLRKSLTPHGEKCKHCGIKQGLWSHEVVCPGKSAHDFSAPSGEPQEVDVEALKRDVIINLDHHAMGPIFENEARWVEAAINWMTTNGYRITKTGEKDD